MRHQKLFCKVSMSFILAQHNRFFSSKNVSKSGIKLTLVSDTHIHIYTNTRTRDLRLTISFPTMRRNAIFFFFFLVYVGMYT